MNFKGNFILFFCPIYTIHNVLSVKVSMHGSMKLGKDIMNTLNHYFIEKNAQRRTMDNPSSKPLTKYPDDLVKSADICKDLDICNDDIKYTVEGYAIKLGAITELLLKDDVPKNKNRSEVVFLKNFKVCLKEFRKILETADQSIDDANNKNVIWSGIIKQMSGTILQSSLSFVQNNIENLKISDYVIIGDILVIEIMRIEFKMENIMCKKHKVCRKQYPCTKALNKLLKTIVEAKEGKISEFVKEFRDVLVNTSLYEALHNITRNEFLFVLNDIIELREYNAISYNVLKSLQITLETRLNVSESEKQEPETFDILLLQMIISDMDHLYSDLPNPFSSFLNKLVRWVDENVPLSEHLKHIVDEISVVLKDKSELLQNKLLCEVGAFLRGTVSKGPSTPPPLIELAHRF